MNTTLKQPACWLDLDHLPFDIREAARRAIDEAKGENPEYYFGDASKFIAAGVGDGKAAFPYKCWMELDPLGMSGSQLTNECTSWGARCNIEICRAVDIVIRNEPESYIKRQTHAVLYGGRNYRGDNGADPITIHKNATKNGIALEQAYCGGKYDFTNYRDAHRLGIQFGGGIPSDLLAEISGQKSEQYAVLRSPQELRDALFNGNGIGVGHGTCTTSLGGKDGLSWLADTGRRNCAHEECIIGYDDTRKYHKECLYVWDNSYDRQAPAAGMPDEYKHKGVFPSGAYVLTEADTMQRVSNGVAVSNSMVKGFPVRVLPAYATESVFS